MSGSTFGNLFKITTWGESHGKALGVVIDGCPAGLPLCEEDNFYARIFLLALHLHVKKPGEAPKQTQELEALFAKHLLDIFQKGNH